MDLQPNPTPVPTVVIMDPSQAAQILSNLLRKTPEYKAFLKALKTVNWDLTIQKLSAEIRGHKTALQWGRDADGQHAAELMRLQLQMEDLPAMKKYHQTEKDLSLLLRAVDEIISHEAGMAFAVNAQRIGCSCSG